MNKLNIQATKVKWVLDEEQRNLCITLLLSENSISIKNNRSTKKMIDQNLIKPKAKIGLTIFLE